MRRVTVWLVGLSAALLLSLEGCSADRLTPARNQRRKRVVAWRSSAVADDKEEKKEAGEPFELPRDRAGQLLGQVLPPRTQQGPLRRPDRPAPPTCRRRSCRTRRDAACRDGPRLARADAGSPQGRVASEAGARRVVRTEAGA